MGMTSVDLRELAPTTALVRAAIRRAYEQIVNDGRFENSQSPRRPIF
jgi:DNA-binding transcriptional regulator YhcF (GntR family)